MSEDFQTRIALEDTIKAKSELLYKLRSSIMSMYKWARVEYAISVIY